LIAKRSAAGVLQGELKKSNFKSANPAKIHKTSQKFKRVFEFLSSTNRIADRARPDPTRHPKFKATVLKCLPKN
jgi:hypothetical protein